MAEGTAIEWTRRPGTIGATLNALVGCQKVSQGCARCYAIETAHLRAGNPLPVMQEKFGGTVKVEGGKRVWTGKVTFTEAALLAPLGKKRPRTYFVNSMSDLFYDGVSDEVIDRHYAVFALCPQHTFIVLTKRPERMRAYLSDAQTWDRIGIAVAELKTDRDYTLTSSGAGTFFLPNVWHLVSVEDQKSADERIPLLLQTPSAVRGVSCEPLLGPVTLRWAKWDDWRPHPRRAVQRPSVERDGRLLAGATDELDGLRMLDWVICGGESGAGARPMHPDWARGLRDQCQAAGVPFFFKQWGEWWPGSDARGKVVSLYNDGRTCAFTTEAILAEEKRSGKHHNECAPYVATRVGKKAAGHLLDGAEWHQFPEVRP